MISELPRAWLAVVRAARLSGEGEVVHPGDAEHGVVDSVVFEAAVAEDLLGLHACEDVLDAGADLLVGLVVCFLPVRKVFALASAVGHDEPGAGIAAVGRRSPARPPGRAGPGSSPTGTPRRTWRSTSWPILRRACLTCAHVPTRSAARSSWTCSPTPVRRSCRCGRPPTWTSRTWTWITYREPDEPGLGSASGDSAAERLFPARTGRLVARSSSALDGGRALHPGEGAGEEFGAVASQPVALGR